MAPDFGQFLQRYRRRVDEGDEPTNGVGQAVANPSDGAVTFTRAIRQGRPHYTVDDHVYRSIRKGKKRFARWDKYIQNDPALRDAMRKCMGKHGSVTVESKLTGQTVRLKK